MADGKVTIAIDVQDKDSRRTVKGLEDSFEGIGGTAKRAGRSIRDMFVSLGLVKMATAAFNVLRSSIDGAISRVDTMNQFPKMMQAIGFSAEDSNKSVNRLSDGIQGLPTTLPSVVATTQQLAIMTGDLDMATELTLALNNAFLTSGASAEDASRGLTQYTQMLATGKVDVMSFRTLQETMGVALNDVAKSFGFAGASAQTDLYSALQDGSITFDEFNNRIIELSQGVGGFAERALIASEGIRTSFTNIRTAVVTGLANMIMTVDKAMQERGFGSIAENLNKVKVAVQQAFAEINAVLPAFVNTILDIISGLDDFIAKWDWLIIGILAGVTAFQVLSTVVPIIIAVYNAVKLWGGLILMIRSFSDGITLLTMAFPLLTNPIFLVSAAIGALVAIGVLLYRNWETITKWAKTLGTALSTGLANAVEKVATWFEKLGFNMDWLRNGFNRLSTWVSNLWNILSNASPLEKITGLFSNFSINADGLRAGIENLTGRLNEMWESFKQSTVFEYIGKALEMAIGRVTGFKDAILALIRDFDLGPMLEQVAMFVPKLIGIFVNKKLGLILAGANIIQSIAEGMGMTVPELFEMITNTIVGMIEQFALALPKVIQTGVDMLTGLIEGFTVALPMVIETIVGLITTITETLIGSLTLFIEMGVQMITSLVEGLVTALPVILEAMISILMAVVEVTLTMLPMLLGLGIQILMAIVDGILEILPVLIETWITVFITLIDTIITILPQIIEVGITLITSLIDGIITALPLVIEAGIQLLTALIQGIISVLPQLIDAGITLIMSLVEAFIGLLPVIIDAGIQILMALIGGLIEVLPALIESGITIIMALVDAFISLLPELLDAGIQILTALIQGIIQMLPELISLGLSLVRQLGSAILSLLPVLLNAGVQLLTSLISGILSMIGSLLSAGRNLVTQLLSTVLSFGGRMLNAGRNLVNNIRSGITSRVSAVVSAISSAIQSVYNKIREWFGRFKTAGSNIVGNIADGIKGSIGKVTGAISGVVSKVRDFLPFSPAKEGPLMDLDRLDFAGPMSDSIDRAKRPLTRAMNDLMESASVRVDDMINLPNANGVVNRAVASGNAGSVNTNNVTNHNGVTIYVEKIENNTEGDIEEQLEEAVWIFDRDKGRM